MFSLDVVQWRRRRVEKDGGKYRAPPSPLPRVDQDRRTKHIYGKTTQEMHAAYLERVGQWVKAAPGGEWGKDYAKENYSRMYMPRVRRKELEHGGPNVKIGAYSPRSVCKGGGKVVKHIIDPRGPSPGESSAEPRDEYRERVINVEKTREKDKEIQPPMAIPTNKPLTCGKFFITDVISSGSTNNNDLETSGAARKCVANCPPSPSKAKLGDDNDVYDRLYHTAPAHTVMPEDPPMTAEYVKSPRWREPDRRKWVAGSFVSTVASTNVHTAQQRRLDGSHSGPTLLISEEYACTYQNPCSPAASPAVRSFEHQRRAKTAAALAQRPIKRMSKKYFVSMWTEPIDTTGTSTSPRGRTAASPSRNPGRQIVDALREKHGAATSPRRQRGIERGGV